MTLIDCLRFIIKGAIVDLPDGYVGIFLNELFKMMLMNNTIVDNEFSLLQDFANIMSINLTIWIIDHGRKYSRSFNTLKQRQDQQQYGSFIVFCQQYGSFYSLYILDTDDKKHTVFPQNDPYIYTISEDFRQSFDCFNASENAQQ
jgi:hypothetical protein